MASTKADATTTECNSNDFGDRRIQTLSLNRIIALQIYRKLAVYFYFVSWQYNGMPHFFIIYDAQSYIEKLFVY